MSARFADLQDAVQIFLRTPQAAADPSQAVKCCLLLADAALHLLEPNLEAARQILDSAAPRVSKLAISDPLTIEYHYRRLELASAQGDADARRQEAQWLTDHAADSPYELAGLLTIANALDREATAAAGDSGLQERAYAAYQRVVTLLEKSGSLAESKNLQVACSRLAHFASQLGHHAEAADQLEKLLQISPQDRRLLHAPASPNPKQVNTPRPSHIGARSCSDCPRVRTTGWRPSTISCWPCPKPIRLKPARSWTNFSFSIRNWAERPGTTNSRN